MNHLYYFIFLILGLLSCSLKASEMRISLEEKVAKSEHVLIGEVVKVSKAYKFPDVEFLDVIRKGIVFELKVREIFKGNQEYEALRIHTGTISGSAGFTGYGVKKGNEFIAYLKKKNEFLTLAGFSNQYLEPINRNKNEAKDIGQSGNKVRLDQKMKDIEKITKQPKRYNKLQQENYDNAR